MRLFRYRHVDGVRPGMLDRTGRPRDLSYVLNDLTADYAAPIEIDILRAIEPDTLPPLEAAPEIATPAAEFGQVFVEGDAIEDAEILSPDAGLPGWEVRAGLAAIVGASNWSGAFMAVRADLAAKRIALGPWLSMPDRPYRLDQLAVAGGGRLGLARHALDEAFRETPSAAVGDLLLLLEPRPFAGGSLEIADLGRQP